MILEPEYAQLFIDGYKKLLLEVHARSGGNADLPVLQMLAEARDAICNDRSLEEAALAALVTRGDAVAPEIVRAIKSLRVTQWVFLKDMRTYSLFLDSSEQDAYAVIGLTNRIRDIIGGTGAIIKTGLVEYRGRYICDGIISDLVWIGPNYKQDFTALFQEIKAKGTFHKTCTPDLPLDG